MVNQKLQRGFSTVEILIAVAIITTMFSAVTLLVLGSQKIAADTELAHEGQLLAEKYLEEGRSAAIANFNNSQTMATVTFPALCASGDAGCYTINRTQIPNQCYKTITVTVDWSVEGRDQNIELNTQIANPQEAFFSGGNCPLPPISGGDNPWESCSSDQTQDIDPSGSQARDLDVANINGTKYLAIAAEHSDTTSHDLWLYRVTANGFTFVSSSDIAGKEGLSALTMARPSPSGAWYLYAVKNNNPQSSDQNQLRIISLADINNPVVEGSLLLTGNNDAKDVVFYNGSVYMAVGNTVKKVNISNPASPTYTDLNLSASVNKLEAQGNFLYAATSDNNGELKVINLSTMSVAGSFNASGNEDGTAVAVIGNTAYLGRERSNSQPDLYVLDTTNPASISPLGSENLNHTATSYIVDIVVSNNMAFIGSTKEEFEVWNVEDPQNIFKQCSPSNTVAQVAAGLDLQDNVVYGAIRSNDAVRRYIDNNNPPQ